MREAHEITQAELGRRSGVSQGYLSQLETGQTGSPAVDTAICLAEAFSLDLGDFLSEIGYYQRGRRRRQKLNRHRHAVYGEYAAMPNRARKLVRELMGMLGPGASSQ